MTDRGRSEDVELFDDILRTFINEANKYKRRFAEIRDEENTLAGQRLISLNYLVRDTTMTNDVLITALENIILDKVPTAPILYPGGQTRAAQWTLKMAGAGHKGGWGLGGLIRDAKENEIGNGGKDAKQVSHIALFSVQTS